MRLTYLIRLPCRGRFTPTLKTGLEFLQEAILIWIQFTGKKNEIMKQNFNHTFFIISCFCFMLLLSCEKEIPLDAEEKEPRIVVNCIFADGDSVYVHVSESRDVLYEGALPNLTTAVAKLYDANGNLLGDFTHQTDGYYKLSNYTPVAGATYKIEVSHAGFNTVNAQTYTPEIISIGSVDTFQTGDYMSYNIKFPDNPSEANYYAITMEKISIYEDEFTGELYYNSEYYFETSEIYTQNGYADIDGAKSGSIFLFSDASFNGSQCSFTGKTYMHPESIDSVIVVVGLHALSEDYFKYKLSLEKYNETAGDPFAQPVQVYSNIENGFGIFGAYSIYRDTVLIE